MSQSIFSLWQVLYCSPDDATFFLISSSLVQLSKRNFSCRYPCTSYVAGLTDTGGFCPTQFTCLVTSLCWVKLQVFINPFQYIFFCVMILCPSHVSVSWCCYFSLMWNETFMSLLWNSYVSTLLSVNWVVWLNISTALRFWNLCTSVNFLLFDLLCWYCCWVSICYFYKSILVSSQSCQGSSSFSYLETCFYTAYCSTSVSNKSLKCWEKPLERSTSCCSSASKHTRAQKCVF